MRELDFILIHSNNSQKLYLKIRDVIDSNFLYETVTSDILVNSQSYETFWWETDDEYCEYMIFNFLTTQEKLDVLSGELKIYWQYNFIGSLPRYEVDLVAKICRELVSD